MNGVWKGKLRVKKLERENVKRENHLKDTISHKVPHLKKEMG